MDAAWAGTARQTPGCFSRGRPLPIPFTQNTASTFPLQLLFICVYTISPRLQTKQVGCAGGLHTHLETCIDKPLW